MRDVDIRVRGLCCRIEAGQIETSLTARMTSKERIWGGPNRGKYRSVVQNVPIYERDGNDITCGLGAILFLAKDNPFVSFEFSSLEPPRKLLGEIVVPEGILQSPKWTVRGRERFYFHEALTACRRNHCGTVKLPTGSGKTPIELTLGVNQLREFGTGVLLVPTNTIKNQFIKSANQFGIELRDYREWLYDLEYDKPSMLISLPMVLYNDLLRARLNPDDPLLKMKHYSIKWIIGDECFSGNSMVLLPNNKLAPIEQIFNQENITHVMSYNIEKGALEPKRILRRIRKKFSGYLPSMEYEVNEERRRLYSTTNHKIYSKSRQDYVKSEDLTKDDTIVFIPTDNCSLLLKCNVCGKEFESSGGLGGHKTLAHNRSNSMESWKSDKTRNPFSYRHKNLMEKRSNNSDYRLSISKRMSDNNPGSDPEVRKRMIESISRRIASDPVLLETMRRNFFLAPRKNRQKGRVTRPERAIINMNLDLTYNGNVDDYRVFRFLDGIGKVPDFLVNGQNKVVEVSNTTYWYPKSYLEKVTGKFKEIGIDCLYLDADFVLNNLEEAKNVIQTFISNHDVKVISGSRKRRGGRPTQYVYDLEVEDNHNYIVDNVLVSNCHHAGCETWNNIFMGLPNLCRSHGFSALPVDSNTKSATSFSGLSIDDAMIISSAGPVIYEKNTKELEDFLNIPSLVNVFYTWPKDKFSNQQTDDWHKIRELQHKNEERIAYIADVIRMLINRNYNTIVHVSDKKLGKLVLDSVNNRKCVAWYGGGEVLGSNVNVEELRAMAGKEILGMICTQHAIEGLDLDSPLNAIVLIEGKKPRQILQKCGRIVRPGEKPSIIVNLIDRGFVWVLPKHGRERKDRILEEFDCSTYDVVSMSQFETVLGLIEDRYLDREGKWSEAM